MTVAPYATGYEARAWAGAAVGGLFGTIFGLQYTNASRAPWGCFIYPLLYGGVAALHGYAATQWLRSEVPNTWNFALASRALTSHLSPRCGLLAPVRRREWLVGCWGQGLAFCAGLITRPNMVAAGAILFFHRSWRQRAFFPL